MDIAPTVDATDASGEIVQVEMQTWNHGAMDAPILYTWADGAGARLASSLHRGGRLE